jgi:hypothetical protein
MPPVIFNVTTKNEKAILDALRKTEARADSVERKLEKVGGKGKQAFGGLSSEIKNVAQTLIGPVGLAGAVTAVVGELKRAYDLMIRNKELAREKHLTIGQSRAAALLNMPSDFKGGASALDAMVERIADKSKNERAKIYQGMSSALSAKGSASDAEFEDAMTLASKVEAATEGQVQSGPLVGSLLDLRKGTGIGDAKTNLGWLRQAGAASRITTLEGQLRMAPGISAAVARGDTAENAMEIQAAISQIISDATGEKTSSGFINLVKDLAMEDISPVKTINRKTGKKKTEWKRLQGANTTERIEELQKIYAEADEDTRAAIEKKIGGRAGMSPFITAMLKDTELFKETMSATQRQVNAPDASASKQADEYLKNIFQGKYGKVLKEDLKTRGAMEKHYSGETVGALEAEAWNRSRQTLDAIGWGGAMPTRLSQDFGAWMHGANLAEQLAGRMASLQEQGIGSDNPVMTELIASLMSLSGEIQELQRNINKNTAVQEGKNSPNAQEVD